ncbi:uncharacterized protein YpmB [Salsuginibacillus halophilus]|uniref:Uncharacterized protein YpmB n=1 Tax=Salsuginibacillus halophilus TaxID=517424 RepID=A0A2P8HWJ5_9BACI|nr:PepSY domain-containing protein [Salsuginibacillus halophilus]PSL50535.1 uncharacterized protein YpmB [Salsuginibacillus halophilus]
MGKWIITFAIVFTLITTAGLTYFYYLIINEEYEAEEAALREVLAETEMSHGEVHDVYRGEETVYTISDENEAQLFFFTFEDGVLAEVDEDELLSRSQIREVFTEQNETTSLRSIRLGYDNVPVFEVTYDLNDGRYGFDYYDAENGERIKRYRLNRERSS